MRHSEVAPSMSLGEILDLGGWVRLDRAVHCSMPDAGNAFFLIPEGSILRLTVPCFENGTVEVELWMGEDSEGGLQFGSIRSAVQGDAHRTFGVLDISELARAVYEKYAA